MLVVVGLREVREGMCLYRGVDTFAVFIKRT